jgi:hypothetical protein
MAVTKHAGQCLQRRKHHVITFIMSFIADRSAISSFNLVMENDMPDQPDLLTLLQLRQVANLSPQPYRVHVQVDSRADKQTSQGAPFFEIKLADAADSLLWRIFDNNPLFHDARSLQRGSFIELTALWIDTGKYGIEPRQPQMRPLTEEEKTNPARWRCGAGRAAAGGLYRHRAVHGWAE